MISVIIPTYNNLNELKITLSALHASLKSLVAATEHEFEIVVSDDGSDDGTQEWIRSNYSEVKYFWHKNLGRGPNRNFGAERANGDTLLFMDSDIEVESDALSHLLMPLHDHPDGVCLGNIRLVVGGRQSPLSNYLSQKCEKLMQRFEKTLDPWDSYSGFFSLSRRFFDKVKGFSSNFQQYGGEDTDFFLRCREAGAQFFFAKDAIGWHHQPLSLKVNLRRTYTARYSSAFISHPRTTSPIEEMSGFGHTWYGQIVKFLTMNRLWSKLQFLHSLLERLPSHSKLAFYFYHFLFLEYAEKGYRAGLKAAG